MKELQEFQADLRIRLALSGGSSILDTDLGSPRYKLKLAAETFLVISSHFVRGHTHLVEAYRVGEMGQGGSGMSPKALLECLYTALESAPLAYKAVEEAGGGVGFSIAYDLTHALSDITGDAFWELTITMFNEMQSRATPGMLPAERLDVAWHFLSVCRGIKGGEVALKHLLLHETGFLSEKYMPLALSEQEPDLGQVGHAMESLQLVVCLLGDEVMKRQVHVSNPHATRHEDTFWTLEAKEIKSLILDKIGVLPGLRGHGGHLPGILSEQQEGGSSKIQMAHCLPRSIPTFSSPSRHSL